MQANLLVKRLGWGLVLFAMVPFILGEELTAHNTTELHDMGQTGTFEITTEEADMTIIVYDDFRVVDCEEYEFNVYDQNQQRITFTKTDCEQWWDSDVYQYKSDPLEPGNYNFDASDDVEILAIEGDIDAYMRDYALGEFISSLGCGFCCFGMLAIIGSSRLGTAYASQENSQVVVMGQSQPVQTFQAVVEPVQSSMYQDIVEQAETVVSVAKAAEDEASPDGSFWGGINDD
ncbi:MAG: hypothetical protein DWC01_03290 [Candidatus Poseidoniales archaeon]|nr:MAG: hypothetical protein DWC01_03290 [Candidatus Poseidoniales archaeon]